MTGYVLMITRIRIDSHGNPVWGLILMTDDGPRALTSKPNSAVGKLLGWGWVGLQVSVDIDRHNRITGITNIPGRQKAEA